MGVITRKIAALVFASTQLQQVALLTEQCKLWCTEQYKLGPYTAGLGRFSSNLNVYELSGLSFICHNYICHNTFPISHTCHKSQLP